MPGQFWWNREGNVMWRRCRMTTRKSWENSRRPGLSGRPNGRELEQPWLLDGLPEITRTHGLSMIYFERSSHLLFQFCCINSLEVLTIDQFCIKAKLFDAKIVEYYSWGVSFLIAYFCAKIVLLKRRHSHRFGVIEISGARWGTRRRLAVNSLSYM